MAHISFAISGYLFFFVGYCFGEIMCIWDSCVYRNGVLCFLIHKSYIRSIKKYCFVRKYAAIPVQLEIFILQYIGWCLFIIWAFILNQFGCFCQFLVIYYYYYYHYLLQFCFHSVAVFLTLITNENT